MTHPGEVVSSVIVLVVSAIAFVLAVLAYKAMQRTHSRSLRFVVAAFGLFVLKGLVVGIALLTDTIRHEHLEVVSSLFDLGIVVLLIWPVLR